MEKDVEYRKQLIQEYQKIVMPFYRYLPWLEKSAGTSASTTYKGQDIGDRSMEFPIYDGTLMNFVRALSKSALMERNYRYIYTRNRIKTPEDERRIIQRATIKEWDMLRGILSRYVLGGMTKGILWNQGVEERIFYLILKRMKDIIEFWTQPQDINESV